MGKWSIHSYVVKYEQYNQYNIGHYELGKTPVKRYGTKLHDKLENDERNIKEISFVKNTESFKQNYLDIFEGLKS